MKNRLINRLLRFGKKHRIFTYPILALVAIISFVCNLFNLQQRSGKRVVAIVLAFLLIVSQSFFMTSSADNLVDDEEAVEVQEQLQADEDADSGQDLIEDEYEDDDESSLVQSPVDVVQEDEQNSADINQDDSIVSEVTDSQDVVDDTSTSDDIASNEENSNDTITNGDGSSEMVSDSNDNNSQTEATAEENEKDDDSDIALLDDENEPEQVEVNCKFYFCDSANSATLMYTAQVNATDPETKECDISSIISGDGLASAIASNESTEQGNYKVFSDVWYFDASFGSSVGSFSSVVPNSGDEIHLYCRRELAQYRIHIQHSKVNNIQTPFSTTATVSASNPSQGETFLVNINNMGSEDQYGILDLTSIRRDGYTLDTISTNDGTIVAQSSTSAAIRFGGSTSDKTITFVWKPNTYKIKYILDEEEGTSVDQTVTFDGNEVYMDGTGKVVPKTGYVFSGKWMIEAFGLEVNSGESIVENQDDFYPLGTVTATPINTYDDVVLSRKKVEFEYKKHGTSGVIQAKYKTVTGVGDFTYEISQASKDLLNQYGIDVTINGNAGFSFETFAEGPIKSTTGSSFSVEINITDNNSTSEVIQPQYVEVSVAPKSITIKAPEDIETTKVYDGNKSVPFADKGPGTLPTTDPDIELQYDSSKLEYNSPNVEEADRIIFSKDNLKIVANNGENINNYKLVIDDSGNYSIPGRITPKKIMVIPKVVFNTGRNYVRAGEDDPKYEFVLENPKDLVEGDTADWLNKITYTTTRPSDKLAERKGNEACGINNASTAGLEGGSNYTVVIDNSSNVDNKFEVIMEKTEENKNFSISGLKKHNDSDWYYGGGDGGITINTQDGYNTPMISLDGGNCYEVASNITEDISNCENVYLYLVSDKESGGTGAVTSPTKIVVKFDSSAPTYEGYTFSQKTDNGEMTYTSGNSTGLYFPDIGSVLDFGTYTKATLNLNVKYNDTVSGVKTLHYGLFGKSPDQEAVFNKETGYATITILAAAIPQIGSIRCYAEDVAGNVSQMIQLSPTGNQEDPYEWGVESIAPKIDSFNVYGSVEDGQKITVNSNREWYNHCTAELVVSDADAGLHQIIWHVNDQTFTTSYEESKNVTSTKLTQAINQGVVPSSDATYSVYAEILDNAGNNIVTDTISFKVDDVPPVLNVEYNGNVWTKEEKVGFTVSDDMSGVNYTKVTDNKGVTIDCYLDKKDDNGIYAASFEAAEKGVYKVVAVDHAGNRSVWEEDIQRISNVAPKCPVISMDPKECDGNNDWFTSFPTIKIAVEDRTSDQTPVDSYYQMWLEGEQAMNQDTIEGKEVERSITEDGIYNLRAWSVSASGVECANSESDAIQIKVDTLPPNVTFKTSRGSGSSIVVDFEVTDNGSGVDVDSIQVLHGSQKKLAEIQESENGYSGKFEVNSTGNYYIVAKDKAGNEAEVAAFTPMSMKIRPVTNISTNSATVGANVIKGTFDIASVNIFYRELSESEYEEAETILVPDESGNVRASAVLSNLVENTNYVYRIVAVSDASVDGSTGEVLEYVGSFKTLSSTNEGISFTGTAKYADDRNGDITVGLYEGNLCIMAMDISAGDDFTFNNVKDGSYTVIATDGEYSKSGRLVIEDGRVIYPEHYMTLILSGKNTSVILTTTDTPNVTADNLDSIFDHDPLNFTDTDVDLIESGGIVEFKLYATLMNVSDVTAAEVSAMYSATDSRKIVGAYLDLSLYKVTTYPDGKVSRERVTELARGANVSVTIPLGELSGKNGLVCVRIHDDGDRYVGAYLTDDDSNPSTYTITTNQFSTYALLYDPSLPVKEENKPTTEQNVNKPSSTVVDTKPQQNVTTEKVVEQPTIEDEEDTDKPDSKKPAKKKTTKKKTNSSTKNSSIGSLRSSGSAKTGDATPVAAVSLLMIVCGIGGLVLRKRKE